MQNGPQFKPNSFFWAWRRLNLNSMSSVNVELYHWHGNDELTLFLNKSNIIPILFIVVHVIKYWAIDEANHERSHSLSLFWIKVRCKSSAVHSDEVDGNINNIYYFVLLSITIIWEGTCGVCGVCSMVGEQTLQWGVWSLLHAWERRPLVRRDVAPCSSSSSSSSSSS